MPKRLAAVAGLGFFLALPLLIRWALPASEKYYLHLLVQIWLWAFVYTGWSLMGRFELTSFGHGAFTGIGAYVTVLLWNLFNLTPWLGIPVAVIAATLAGMLVAYPCFTLKIRGHYFALLTLAFTEFVRLCIVGLRNWTGGSLGTQPHRYGEGVSIYAMQFETDRQLAYFIAFAIWLAGLAIWIYVDRSMDRFALDAVAQDEDAAASVGINVTRVKLKVTAISAAMCAFGGAVYGQYQMYIGPDTVAGLSISLNMVFASIAGGIWVLLGPTFGAFFTQIVTETLRVAVQGSPLLKSWFGDSALALDQGIYGLLLILFIIYMPKGILGTLQQWWSSNPEPATERAITKPSVAVQSLDRKLK